MILLLSFLLFIDSHWVSLHSVLIEWSFDLINSPLSLPYLLVGFGHEFLHLADGSGSFYATHNVANFHAFLVYFFWDQQLYLSYEFSVENDILIDKVDVFFKLLLVLWTSNEALLLFLSLAQYDQGKLLYLHLCTILIG